MINPYRSGHAVRRAVLALGLTAAAAFVAVAGGSTALAEHIAADQELAEAMRTGQLVTHTVLAPALPDAVRGDASAITLLNEAVWVRRGDGSVVHLTVITGAGRVVYSDDLAQIGLQHPLTGPVHAALGGVAGAAFSTAGTTTDPAAAQAPGRMIQTHLPLHLDGATVAVLIDSTDARLRTAHTDLVDQLLWLALGSLAVLLLLQLPVSIQLVRTVARSHRERTRLLGNALAASERERRRIARDLHDGVVQDLAGADYAIESLTRNFPAGADPPDRRLLELTRAALQRSVHELRTLIIDIDPPDLTAHNLAAAIEHLAARLRNTHRIELRIPARLPSTLSPTAAATLYRTARECLTNISAHAGASTVRIELHTDASAAYLRIEDDGRGIPADVLDGHRDGHAGLRLLAEAATDLNGRLDVTSGRDNGTAVTLTLPIHADGAPSS